MVKTGVEYATDQITVYRFCPYNCKYCWAWRLSLYSKRIKKGKYNPIEEARKYLRARKKRTIVVSFTSDPYPPVEKENKLTRKVLEILSKAKKHRILILTKNPELALRDLDLMKAHGDMWLGTTLTSTLPNVYELYVPTPVQRMNALYKAYKQGVKTWISLEPIIPDVTFPETIIMLTYAFTDFYVLGALSYHKETLNISRRKLKMWYDKHLPRAIKILEIKHKKYFIKNNLKKYLNHSNK